MLHVHLVAVCDHNVMNRFYIAFVAYICTVHVGIYLGMPMHG